MYGHGVNMHFGSQTNPSLWSGTIIAKGGKYRAGIGGGRYSYSSAIGLFESVVSLIILMTSNFLSKKFMGRGLY